MVPPPHSCAAFLSSALFSRSPGRTTLRERQGAARNAWREVSHLSLELWTGAAGSCGRDRGFGRDLPWLGDEQENASAAAHSGDDSVRRARLAAVGYQSRRSDPPCPDRAGTFDLPACGDASRQPNDTARLEVGFTPRRQNLRREFMPCFAASRSTKLSFEGSCSVDGAHLDATPSKPALHSRRGQQLDELALLLRRCCG